MEKLNELTAEEINTIAGRIVLDLVDEQRLSPLEVTLVLATATSQHDLTKVRLFLKQ